MADAYILALSSQSGFCQTYGYEAGKPECVHLSEKSYESNHLTLHGLWPNQSSCGQHYGFCTSVPMPSHCDYDPVPLSASVSMELKQLMPSYREGSCLERHEWNKHGSCQNLAATDYFAKAMKLTKEVAQSPFGQYVTDHKGQKVKLSALLQQIVISFGEENVHKVYLGCNKGVLVDVYLSLPSRIDTDDTLVSLVSKAADYPLKNKCSSNVTISGFHHLQQRAWS